MFVHFPTISACYYPGIERCTTLSKNTIQRGESIDDLEDETVKLSTEPKKLLTETKKLNKCCKYF